MLEYTEGNDVDVAVQSSESRSRFLPAGSQPGWQLDRTLHFRRDESLSSSKDAFAQPATGVPLEIRRREALPLARELRRPCNTAILLMLLVAVATMAAAFVETLYAYRLGSLERPRSRFSATGELPGACERGEGSNVEVSSDSLMLSAEQKQKVARVTELLGKLAETCEVVFMVMPVAIRVRGTQELLGSAIVELASLEALLGEESKESRDAAAAKVIDVVDKLTHRDSKAATSVRVRSTVNGLKKFLETVKDSGPGRVPMPHDVRMKELEELLLLQEVAFSIQTEAVSSLSFPGDVASVQATAEELKPKLCPLRAVVRARQSQVFSNPNLNEWFLENERGIGNCGFFIKRSSAEALKMTGPAVPLVERMEQLRTAAIGAIGEDFLRKLFEKADAAAEEQHTSGSDPHENNSGLIAASLQAAPQTESVGSHPTDTLGDFDHAQLEASGASLFSLQHRQEPDFSGPLIGLPIHLMSVLQPSHAPSPSQFETSSEQALAAAGIEHALALSETEGASDKEHGPGVPRAPTLYNQGAFKGHPLGEPYPSETGDSDP